MENSITKTSPDGKWKAVMTAFKNDYFFYKSIGTECTVYHLEQTKNIWGQTRTDWVEKAANIAISNTYGGDQASSYPEGTSKNASYHEMKKFATGFFSIKIYYESGKVQPGTGSSLRFEIKSVKGHIGVNIPNVGALFGDVSI